MSVSVRFIRPEDAPPMPTLTPGGNLCMVLYAGTLYIGMTDHLPVVTALDEDRAAALGYVLDGTPAPWPFPLGGES